MPGCVSYFGGENSMPSPARSDENYSPGEVAQAEPYYSLNPGLFDSVEHWKYRDLQKLAKTLGISAGGKREDVVVRLQEYHRERRHSGQAGMFHSVEVKANDGGAAINPVLLSPLLNCKATAGAPSPAKSARAVGKNWEMNSPRASAMPRTPKGLTPIGTPTRSPLCPRSNGTVLFSPFNMVKLIPAKEHSENYGQYREPSYDDDDGLDEDEEGDGPMFEDDEDEYPGRSGTTP